MRPLFLLSILCLGWTQHGFGTSNIDPVHPSAWGSNIGWVNWRSDSFYGAEIGHSFCSGYLYAANLGWISLGDGSPTDGVQYRNDSASDFGVNVDAAGQLRGLAYGANVGWISFEERGAPRLDLATGRLSGFAYGANIDWINLGENSFWVAVHLESTEDDHDGDGIPDAWELLYAGNTTTFGADTDFDQDGQTDLEEYLADTDPTDPEDNLRVVEWALGPDRASLILAWASKPTRQYSIEVRSQFLPESLWLDSGLGVQQADGKITRRTVPLQTAPEFLRIRAVGPLNP